MWLVPQENEMDLQKVFYLTANKLMYGNIFKENGSVTDFP